MILLVIFWIGTIQDHLFSIEGRLAHYPHGPPAVHIMVLPVRGLKWGFIMEARQEGSGVNFIVKTIGLFARSPGAP